MSDKDKSGFWKPLSGLLIALVLFGSGLLAADKPATVDSGSFGVFVNGQRVATETFQIRQGATISTATSEFKNNASGKSTQKSELQIDSAGNLRRYELRELSPGKAHIVVEPSQDFLIEHVVPDPPQRPIEQPFIMPPSTMVLDDYVFSQRQILAWRYLAQACSGNLQQCRPQRLQFGVIVPRQQTSLLVSVEYAGLEKTMVRGVERQLSRLNMKLDDVDWALYLDADLKVIRMLIPSEGTEVLRD
jgi:hypothetical protein